MFSNIFVCILNSFNTLDFAFHPQQKIKCQTYYSLTCVLHVVPKLRFWPKHIFTYDFEFLLSRITIQFVVLKQIYLLYIIYLS